MNFLASVKYVMFNNHNKSPDLPSVQSGNPILFECLVPSFT
jgi:hypothetical protein